MAQQEDYKHGLSLCCLAHSIAVPPFGEEGLAEFLDHVSPEAEEVNLADTSPEGHLADRLKGKAAQNVRIFRTPYDTKDFDFAANRNYSIAQAGHEWILVLDPGEDKGLESDKMGHGAAERNGLLPAGEVGALQSSGDAWKPKDRHDKALQERQGVFLQRKGGRVADVYGREICG